MEVNLPEGPQTERLVTYKEALTDLKTVTSSRMIIL
jgi:hypothetical protein